MPATRYKGRRDAGHNFLRKCASITITTRALKRFSQRHDCVGLSILLRAAASSALAIEMSHKKWVTRMQRNAMSGNSFVEIDPSPVESRYINLVPDSHGFDLPRYQAFLDKADTVPASSKLVHDIPIEVVVSLAQEGEPSRWTASGGKRAFDIVMAGSALVATTPILLVSAAAIKLTSRGPVFFLQKRMGKDSQEFTILKFRTMRCVPEEDGLSVTKRRDPRITAVGRVLRRSKLDELPQLINILRGDMSIVGPRPKLPHHECVKLSCRPGLTGAATIRFINEEEILAGVANENVEGYTTQVLNPIKARLDLAYANTSTFKSDLALIAKTAGRLLHVTAGKLLLRTGASSVSRKSTQEYTWRMTGRVDRSEFRASSSRDLAEF